MPNADPSGAPAVLIVTTDVVLLDDLLRIAAAAGVEAEVASDPGAARASWEAAALVLLGDDASQAAAGPRRRDVYLVSHAMDDATVWKRAVAAGAQAVVLLPDGAPSLVELMGDACEGPIRSLSIGVVGGCGGAGASTLAASLALAAARSGSSACVVDADVLGGGIDLIAGAEESRGLRWPDFTSVSGRIALGSFTHSLPVSEGVRFVSWDRGPFVDVPFAAVDSVTRAVRRAYDVVVVDLARTQGAGATAFTAWLDVVLIVVPGQFRPAAAARRIAASTGFGVRDVRVVVRHGKEHSLDPMAVADSIGFPLLGRVPHDSAVAEAVDHGTLPLLADSSPWMRACAGLLEGLHLARPVIPRAA